MKDQITAITANFKTPDLINGCVESFLEQYPDLPYVLVDNGGCLKSRSYIQDVAEARQNVSCLLNTHNVYHGPALNQGIREAQTPFVFTLDSDTVTKKGGFLEKMLDRFQKNPQLLAIGWLRYVGGSGVPFRDQTIKQGNPYVHPFAMLMDKAKFSSLPAFLSAGAPARGLMIAAIREGFRLEDFPIGDYIWHKEAGTRGLFGGRFKVPTDLEPEPWAHRRI